jgi:hypothetical protein
MDIDTARNVIQAAFRAAGELQSLLPVLKERCSADEYKLFMRGIAAAVDGINVGLTNRALSSHPELAGEIESNLARSGHAMP